MTRKLAGLIALLGVIVGALLLLARGSYGLTIFVLVPVLIGALACLIFRPGTSAGAAMTGAIANLVAVFSLLVFGKEGFGCILVALPLIIPLGILGALIVRELKSARNATRGITMMLLLSPASFTFDTTATPIIYEVHSSIEIAAPPERVWPHVVSFPDLPEPKEWFFQTGLAYPQRTRIVGSGVGAVRYCDLSTGPAIESVEIWDAPHLLQFRVLETPAPMREWTPYKEVSPKHLHGYFISKRGQFKLTELPNHHTLVEGTSWYQHGLWPAQYWHLWTDVVFRQVHMRVLKNIKALSEEDEHGHS